MWERVTRVQVEHPDLFTNSKNEVPFFMGIITQNSRKFLKRD